MDALDTITKLINSPPGQLAAGAVLAGIVWKFFERVEDVLNDDARKGITAWLLDPKNEPRFKEWFGAVERSFFTICGTEPSFVPLVQPLLPQQIKAISVMGLICWMPCTIPVVWDLYKNTPAVICTYTVVALIVALLACMLMVFFSISSCNVFRARVAPLQYGFLIPVTLFLAVGFLVPVISFRIIMYGHFITHTYSTDTVTKSILRWWESALISGLIISFGIWLSAVAGLLLKAACHLDSVLSWFKRYLNIEKKPLQSIGLVAGALVALVYWAALIVARVMIG